MCVLVSVIIPTYNRAKVIGETIDSVLAQTIIEWECIVVDDGSSDETSEIMSKYVEKDPRIVYIRRPSDRNKGGNTCRNIGLENAKGEYIQFLDSDDLISPNKFEVQLKALKNSEQNAIAICKWGEFNTITKSLCVEPWRPTYISSKSPIKLLDIFGYYGTFLINHVYLIKRSVVDKAGFWDENLAVNQDGEYFTRIILSSSEIIFVPEAEAYYRIGIGNNTSTLSNEEKVKEMIKSWKMINDTIRKKAGITNHAYVRQAKTGLYNKLKEKFPKILKDNAEFFNSRYTKLEYLYMRVKARIMILSQYSMFSNRS